MGQDQVIIGDRQPELLLKPANVFRKAIRFSCQTTVTLSLCQVVSLNKAGVDCFSDRRTEQLRCDFLWFSGIRSGGYPGGSDEDQINIYRKADIGDVE